MKQMVNEVYEPLFRGGFRYAILMGGRGAGRSTVASQYANAKIIALEYFRCAIMRYVLGDIRNSIYREIIDRAEENGVMPALDVNESTMTIQHRINSINAVGFKKSSGDQKAKLKSLANYNCVIIEEADEIPEEDFMQLDDSLRTLKGDIVVILLLNPPPKSHWIIRRWFDLQPSGVKDFYIPVLKKDVADTLFLHTSYLDNIINISDQTVRSYENYSQTKPDHYWNMVKGFVPEVVKGKIYKNWKVIDSLPPEARLARRGLDYGYSNDPSALVGIYNWNGAIILDEELYRTGVSNGNLSAVILSQDDPDTLVVADSAEPKSNDDLKARGVNIIGSKKGGDSINFGIKIVQEQTIFVTRRSKNLIEEYDNYAWMVDKDGNVVPTPKPGRDHLMDAVRYGLETMFKDSNNEAKTFYPKPAHPQGRDLPIIAGAGFDDRSPQAATVFIPGFK